MRRSRSKLIKKSENKSSESPKKILTNANSQCKGTSRRSMAKNKNPVKLSQDICNPQYWTSYAKLLIIYVDFCYFLNHACMSMFIAFSFSVFWHLYIWTISLKLKKRDSKSIWTNVFLQHHPAFWIQDLLRSMCLYYLVLFLNYF